MPEGVLHRSQEGERQSGPGPTAQTSSLPLCCRDDLKCIFSTDVCFDFEKSQLTSPSLLSVSLSPSHVCLSLSCLSLFRFLSNVVPMCSTIVGTVGISTATAALPTSWPFLPTLGPSGCVISATHCCCREAPPPDTTTHTLSHTHTLLTLAFVLTNVPVVTEDI